MGSTKSTTKTPKKGSTKTSIPLDKIPSDSAAASESLIVDPPKRARGRPRKVLNQDDNETPKKKKNTKKDSKEILLSSKLMAIKPAEESGTASSYKDVIPTFDFTKIVPIKIIQKPDSDSSNVSQLNTIPIETPIKKRSYTKRKSKKEISPAESVSIAQESKIDSIQNLEPQTPSKKVKTTRKSKVSEKSIIEIKEQESSQLENSSDSSHSTSQIPQNRILQVQPSKIDVEPIIIEKNEIYLSETFSDSTKDQIPNSDKKDEISLSDNPAFPNNQKSTQQTELSSQISISSDIPQNPVGEVFFRKSNNDSQEKEQSHQKIQINAPLAESEPIPENSQIHGSNDYSSSSDESSSDESEKIDICERQDLPQDLADRAKKLSELRLKMKDSVVAGKKDVYKEFEKSKVNPKANSKLEKRREAAQELLFKQKVEDSGLDYERIRSWDYSIENVEKYNSKAKEKEENTVVGFADWNDVAQRKYNKLVKELKPDMESYNYQKKLAQQVIQSSGNSIVTDEDVGLLLQSQLSKPNDHAIEKLSKSIIDQQNKRTKTMKVPKESENDVTFINDRNAHFNRKINRAFDRYTKDIKDAFERGTAL
ncbi:Pre-mRNA-splicing factor syf2 [Smittium mucronatum]|uniref:Pre-mRNA-splicing factor SYF2 n=1 Tax=Smittium mucronatum TaxID=133383 RepID=A0A1R0GSA8_9FUNG|nr:Pre-mRNA-splicing factor syf2 [Smittium mucronatum]